MEINKHGLKRQIPADIKRAVRQRDGFGCIRCGMALFDYDHLEPEFAEATEHSAEGIVLLCATCHAMKTRGRLSIETLNEAKQSPKAKSNGFSFGPFDIGNQDLEIRLGTTKFVNVGILLRVCGENLISVDRPEFTGGPFLLNAAIYDSNHEPIMKIVRNEWQTPTTNWDVRVEADRITINSDKRAVEMILRTDPPKFLVFEKLEMLHRGFKISAAEGRNTTITTPTGHTISTQSMELYDCSIGIDVSLFGLMVGLMCERMIATNIAMNGPRR